MGNNACCKFIEMSSFCVFFSGKKKYQSVHFREILDTAGTVTISSL